MVDIDWERRQTQPRQSVKAMATHSGSAHDALPEVFLRSVFMRVFALCSDERDMSMLVA